MTAVAGGAKSGFRRSQNIHPRGQREDVLNVRPV